MQGMPLKIDKKVLVSHELEIDELREKIGTFSLKNNPKVPEYTRLVSSSETDWDWDQVKTMLTQDPSTLAPSFRASLQTAISFQFYGEKSNT
jgi:hypothetical protein